MVQMPWAGKQADQDRRLEILLVVHDALIDEFVKAADPLQFVFQLRVGKDPLAFPILGDDNDFFDVFQVLIKTLDNFLDGALALLKGDDVFVHGGGAGKRPALRLLMRCLSGERGEKTVPG
jgi:hypothetical protein